jgi:deazaflavin-dependent oxidoreductase (nitroreductase family)
MHRAIDRPVVGVAILAACLLAVVGARRLRYAVARTGPVTPAPPLVRPEWLRRFVTERFNPFVTSHGLVGGRRSPWAYLEHVGRRSGRRYRTPVLPKLRGGFAYVPLAYGPDVQWARNVRAAGTCRLQVHETVYELDGPATITAAEHPAVPAALRPWIERRGDRYLRLRVMSARPGRLDDAPAAPAAGSRRGDPQGASMAPRTPRDTGRSAEPARPEAAARAGASAAA